MLGLCAVGVLLGNSHHFHGIGTTMGVHVIATGQDDVVSRLGDALLHQQRERLIIQLGGGHLRRVEWKRYHAPVQGHATLGNRVVSQPHDRQARADSRGEARTDLVVLNKSASTKRAAIFAATLRAMAIFPI